MNLFYLNHLIQQLPEFKAFSADLSSTRGTRICLGLPEQAYSIFTASIYDTFKSPVLFISAHPELAKRRYEQIKLWVKNEESVFYLPEIDLLAGKVSVDPQVISERLRVLSLLAGCNHKTNTKDLPPFIVSSAISLSNRSISSKAFISSCIEIHTGLSVKQMKLLEMIRSIGYASDEVVEIPGTYCKRGGIVDVYPTSSEWPIRIEFLGDYIESIREYDPRTQRSSAQLSTFIIPPAKELSLTGEANILDYLPQQAIVILDDMSQIEAEIEKIENQVSDLKLTEENESDVQRSEPIYFKWNQIVSKLDASMCTIELSNWTTDAKTKNVNIQLPVDCAPNYTGRFSSLADCLSDLRDEDKRIIIVSLQADRIRELLQESGIEVHPSHSLTQLPTVGSLSLIQGYIEGGWRIKQELLLLTDLEIFGTIKQRRSTRARPVRHHWLLNDISIGDLVVHVEHGIGRFAGVSKKVRAGVEQEYMVLEYAGGDTLYVPVSQIDRVSLYIGGGERTPSLSRLGSQEWNRARQKVKESVANIAEEMIVLYAVREVSEGVAFSPDTLWQQELEASFQYTETADQLAAVKAVKEDMESSRPMDRLICGDVGYGKTEIAVRAAFKAVMGGKQVAILVPTTILAQQHFNTFKERLKSFPVHIAVLSRFCSQRQQSEIIEHLANGEVDICIGTHRLLQKDVIFKNLGLAVIDEEQRFGVAHKEHFKKMRQSVDVLTLSATPIPRTMHMALAGIRDLSTIETPPENRLPVLTYVGEFNDKLVREAILREMERDGQIFIVHNRVNTINMVASKIASIVPEAKISVAHGQMDEEKLEKIVAGFMQGDNDVLITTTIIESGLDMPNVNTLIVDTADNLGLTQLYQLRGRVGRGANTAYAYFLFNSRKNLTDHARDRLKTISRFTELGAGFAIAMKDLEIRGAGNLLGLEQSGNISAVGFNYYCRLLAEAVEEIKAKRNGHPVQRKTGELSVSIDLKIPAFIPDWYVTDNRTRFNLYHRLAKSGDFNLVKDIDVEMTDRFGEVPEEVANLLYIVELKHLAASAGVESILHNNDMIVITFNDENIAGDRLSKFPKKKGVEIGNRQIRLHTELIEENWKPLLKQILGELVITVAM